MTKKSNQSLLEQWPAWGDKDFLSLCMLLRDDDIKQKINGGQNPLLALSGLGRTIPSHEVERMKSALYSEKIQQIEKNKLFKLLNKNNHFKEALEWMKGRREYKNGAPEIKVKFIYSVVHAVMGHSETLKENRKKYASTEEIKNLKAQASNLKKRIQKVGKTNDYALQDCCEHLMRGLDYLIEHKPRKKMRADTTYSEREFLYGLVYWFEHNNLPRLPALFTKLLDMVDTPNLGANRRNLISNIRDCEKQIVVERNKLMAWYLCRDAGK